MSDLTRSALDHCSTATEAYRVLAGWLGVPESGDWRHTTVDRLAMAPASAPLTGWVRDTLAPLAALFDADHWSPEGGQRAVHSPLSGPAMLAATTMSPAPWTPPAGRTADPRTWTMPRMRQTLSGTTVHGLALSELFYPEATPETMALAWATEHQSRTSRLVPIVSHRETAQATRHAVLSDARYVKADPNLEILSLPFVRSDAECLRRLALSHLGVVESDASARLVETLAPSDFSHLVREAAEAIPRLAALFHYATPEQMGALRPTRDDLALWFHRLPSDTRVRALGLVPNTLAPRRHG